MPSPSLGLLFDHTQVDLLKDHLEISPMWSTRDPAEVKLLQGSFDRFYSENEKVLQEAVDMDILNANTSKKLQRFEAATAMFLEQSKVVLEGLKFLGELHPVLAVAINAFTGVVTLEILRRDIDLKALGVKIQMQNMMCSLFEARKLRVDEENLTLGKQLAQLMNDVAKEITECGSTLNCYLERHFISRIARAPEFEKRLADYISSFEKHRSTLHHLLTSYTAGVVQKTHAAVNRLEYQVENLISILHRLESSQEKEAARFIDANGGIEKCIGDKKLLVDLMNRTGDSFVDFRSSAAYDEESRARMVELTMKQVQNELKEDFEDMLQKNLSNFETMLQIQSKNLELVMHHVYNQTSLMMKISNEMATMFPGKRAYVLITDPVLKSVWEKMELRRSVRAKKFVLTFKDYHTQLHPSATVLAAEDSSPTEVPPATNLESESVLDSNGFSFTVGPALEHSPSEDEWALNYIDVVHLDPIVEAIDADLSGFISIQEANMFAVGRPKGWSLLLWFAYWAAGWAISVRKHKERILDTFQQIFDARLKVLPCNGPRVGDYFESEGCQLLDCITRSTQPPASDGHDVKLDRLVCDYDTVVEQRLRANLEGLKYNLSSVDKVTLVTGPGRIERFVLPLVHLLLQHHLRIVKLAATRRLAENEMWLAELSLLSVFKCAEERAKRLEAIFRQKSRGLEDQFKKFAFGMLEPFAIQLPYKWSDNKLLDSQWRTNKDSYSDSLDGHIEVSVEGELDSTLKMLGEDPGPHLVLEKPLSTFSFLRPELESDSGPCALDGNWSARLFWGESTPLLSLAVQFRSSTPSEELTGTINSYMGSVTFSGTLRREWRTGEDDAVSLNADSDSDERDDRKISPTVDGGLDGTHSENADTEAPEDSSASDGYEQGSVALGGAGTEGVLLILEFETSVILGYDSGFYFRLSPSESLDGRDSLHWKGEWCYTSTSGSRSMNLWSCEFFRMPPEGLRYRHIIDEHGKASSSEEHTDTIAPSHLDSQSTRPASPKNNATRARWAFAIEVICYQVRQRLYPAIFYNMVTKERGRYITLYLKELNGVMDCDDETKELWKLRTDINPAVVSVWTTISEYYYEKDVAPASAGRTLCDYCKRSICFVRHICITCALDSMNNQVDICEQCLTKEEAVTSNAFSHKPSHTLLKTRNRRIIKVERAKIIFQARDQTQRVKKALRPPEPKNRKGPQMTMGAMAQNDSVPNSPECSHCDSDIELPCWVCTECDDVLICKDCEVKGVHDMSHPLLRIVDFSEEGSVPENEKEDYIHKTKEIFAQEMQFLEGKVMATLTERMDGLEKQFVRGMANLEEGLNDRMDGMGIQMENIEHNVSYHPTSGRSSGALALSAVQPPSGATPGDVSEVAALSLRMDKLEAMVARILEAVESR